ncbi:hypothetical protein FACS1894172_19040 [Spirochaetia bacterium]|nr:hypothetical protein FACS1894164_01470 [Spirochaetia bacterium]GHU36295.1 hypothetical protein FACS1894172_19040 [Spirochaetia bacterium]
MKIMLYLWQLPQIVLALFILLWFRIRGVSITKSKFKEKIIYYININSNWGVSLGEFIFLSCGYDETIIRHEYGHCIQSLYFGWLYLIAVGIPSAIFTNLWDQLFHKTWTAAARISWYYSRYPEKWADILGNVDRRY